MSDSDKMRAEIEQWAKSQFLLLTRINWKDGTVSEYAYTATLHAWQIWQAAYAAGRKAEREEVDYRTEKLLTEFRSFIEEVEQTGIYYENARVATALANGWRVFDDIAAQIRNKPKGKAMQMEALQQLVDEAQKLDMGYG